jgi:hypothetical protein
VFEDATETVLTWRGGGAVDGSIGEPATDARYSLFE